MMLESWGKAGYLMTIKSNNDTLTGTDDRHGRPPRVGPHTTVLLLAWACLAAASVSIAKEPSLKQLGEQYETRVRPLVERYCLECHSSQEFKGEVNLQRFKTADDVLQSTRLWQKVIDQLHQRTMPPEDNPQPTDQERQQWVQWAKQFLLADALTRAGDPGLVLMRRLTNAEYDNTIRDLTGVDLGLTAKFPADSVAGEGFANTGEALIMAPELLPKYLDAARQVASRAVLTSTGVRFSAVDDRVNWTAELVTQIQSFYSHYTNKDGTLPLVQYIAATLQYRERKDENGNLTLEKLANDQGLSSTYLDLLWNAFHDPQAASDVLQLAQRWRELQPGEAQELVNEIVAQQEKHWKVNQQRDHMVGSIGLFGRYLISLAEDPPDADENSQPEQSVEPPQKTLAGQISVAQLFPPVFCFAEVMPVNGDVTVELFLRDDEPFCRLLVSPQEKQEMDRLWDELIFVSRAPMHEAANMKDFLIYQPADRVENIRMLKELLPQLVERGAEFESKTLPAAEPKQLDAVVQLAVRAWRHPLEADDETRLRDLYQSLRQQEQLLHEDAIRTVLTRILISPKFLYRIERPSGDKTQVPVSNWELASRLSYFLWSSLPDERLQSLAAEGRLQDPAVLAQETQRMLVDWRAQGLSVEFACQWLQVRGFAEHAGKDENRFPTYTPALREAMNEEPIQFISDMIRNDRSVLELVRARHSFLNEELANHYNIPGVEGPTWQRIEGVDRYQRGGVLTMGSVLAKQSGALRTSPVLRGTWVVETLLGREIPNPPDDIPQLAKDEANKEGLSMRQLVDQHRSDPSCASCHQKIDPYGFALEAYDPIGRLREKDLNGNPIDARTELPDGKTLEGLKGLQDYLMECKEEFLLQFCRKLLGYALGRTVELSDEPLLREMKNQLANNEYRFSTAGHAIVQSNQFRQHRGPNDQEEIP